MAADHGGPAAPPVPSAFRERERGPSVHRLGTEAVRLLRTDAAAGTPRGPPYGPRGGVMVGHGCSHPTVTPCRPRRTPGRSSWPRRLRACRWGFGAGRPSGPRSAAPCSRMRLCRAQSRSSSPVTVVSARTATTAATRSPQVSSGTPTTTQSVTPGWESRAFSTSCGCTFSPPVLITPEPRPRNRIAPSASRRARSPGIAYRTPSIVRNVVALFSVSL